MENNMNLNTETIETVAEEVTTGMNGFLKYGLIGVAAVAVGYSTYRFAVKPLVRKFKKTNNTIELKTESDTVDLGTEETE